MTAASHEGSSDAMRKAEFIDCYVQHQDRLRTYAAWLAPHVDWESAVHDAFVKAYIHWDNINTSKGAWLTKTVHNSIIDLVRSCEQPIDACDAFNKLMKNSPQLQRARSGEEWHELMQTFAATQELPHHLRAAVILRFEGSKDDEIAHVLDVDRATVRRYVSEALRLISEQVGNQERRLSMRRAQRPRRQGNGTTAQGTEAP
jgi:RNA polymerase sigma-70 factor (ECF subfamily)